MGNEIFSVPNSLAEHARKFDPIGDGDVTAFRRLALRHTTALSKDIAADLVDQISETLNTFVVAGLVGQTNALREALVEDAKAIDEAVKAAMN